VNYLDLVLCDRPVIGPTAKQRLEITGCLLLQELLLSRIHYQTPSCHWLWYHTFEASCLLYHGFSHTSITVFTRSLVIIIQIQGLGLGIRFSLAFGLGSEIGFATSEPLQYCIMHTCYMTFIYILKIIWLMSQKCSDICM